MPSITYSDLLPSNSKKLLFDGREVTIVSAPLGSRIDISKFLRDPEDFHGPTDVDQVINFGSSLSGLIGKYNETNVLFNVDQISLASQVLAEINKEAKDTILLIDGLARKLIKDPSLYDDKDFCFKYYRAAKRGYYLLNHINKNGKFQEEWIDPINERGIPVSLIRAGLITTRLARELEYDAEVPGEVQVETKRFHPINGSPKDISVSVRWGDFNDPGKLKNQIIEVADFVNPASWASCAALLLALKHSYDVTPTRINHRSIIGTKQGVALAKKVCEEMGIESHFKLLAFTDTMNESYYLTGDIAVGDAGQALRHFRPRQFL